MPKAQRIANSARTAESVYLDKIDSVDTYLTAARGLTMDEFLNRFLSAAPAWIQLLVRLRNQIVGRMGLKTGEASAFIETFKKTENELIVGANDRHLDFRVLLEIKGPNLEVSTFVSYKNLAGRAYFTVVRPFHHIIVRTLLNRL